VVFRRNDYLAPGASNVFKEVLRLSQVQAAAKNLAQVASGPMGQIPSLADFLQQRGIPQITVSFTAPAQAVRVAYQGPYAVFNATNYAAVFAMVGNKIELVGQIHSVRKLYKHGRHFVFVNFSNWLGQAVKLSIWSDGLNALGNEVPTKAWVGKWVTVSGLVDEPYQGNSRDRPYTHVSITVTQRGQIQTLTEAEAQFRLGTGSQPTAAPLNSEVLRKMGGTTRSVPPKVSPAPSVQPVSPKSGNQRVIDQMRKQTPPAPVLSSKAPSPTYSAPQKQFARKERGIGIGGWILIIFVALAALRACAG